MKNLLAITIALCSLGKMDDFETPLFSKYLIKYFLF